MLPTSCIVGGVMLLAGVATGLALFVLVVSQRDNPQFWRYALWLGKLVGVGAAVTLLFLLSWKTRV